MIIPLYNNQNNICENADQNQMPLIDIELLVKNDTLEFGIKHREDIDLNTTLFGKEKIEKFLNECKSIIKTEIN